LGDQIKKNGMGGACNTYGERGGTEFWWANLRERGYLEDPGLDGRLILKMAIQEVTCGAGTGFL
jgi:hypothetical protein